MTADDGHNADLTHAGPLIDRCGGIRFVARRLDVPVGTVQGWKRDGVIPADYRDAMQKLAAENKVEFNGEAAVPGAPAATFQMPPLKSSASQAQLLDEIKAAESRAIQKGALVTILLLGATAIVAAFLLWPVKQDLDRDNRQVALLQQQTSVLQRNTAESQAAIPQQIKQSITQLQSTLNASARQVDNVTGGGLEGRVTKLEAQVAALASPAALQAMLAHINVFQQSASGQHTVADAVHALAGVAGAGDDNANFAQTAQVNGAAHQVLSGVAPSDMKAAALLLGLAHLRFALGRSDVPFGDDVALLEKTVGANDPELDAALDRMEPIAATGVLTPEEDAAEFSAKYAARILTAQGQGQGQGKEPTLSDRALSRFGDAVQVRKDGALVDGSDTQESVDQAKQDLAHGDLAGASSALHGLQGPAAAAAAPWVAHTDATLLAQHVAEMAVQRVTAQLGGNGLALTTLGAAPTSLNGVETLATPAPLVSSPDGAAPAVPAPAQPAAAP